MHLFIHSVLICCPQKLIIPVLLGDRGDTCTACTAFGDPGLPGPPGPKGQQGENKMIAALYVEVSQSLCLYYHLCVYCKTKLSENHDITHMRGTCCRANIPKTIWRPLVLCAGAAGRIVNCPILGRTSCMLSLPDLCPVY